MSQRALLLAESVLLWLEAMLATKAQQMLPIKVTAKIVVVLLFPTVVTAPAELVKGRLAHVSVNVVLLPLPIIRVVTVQGEHFHLRRVFRYRQSSPCWKPGWRVHGRI